MPHLLEGGMNMEDDAETLSEMYNPGLAAPSAGPLYMDGAFDPKTLKCSTRYHCQVYPLQ